MDRRISAIIIITFLVLGAAMSASAKVDVDDITVTLSKEKDDIGDDYLKIDVGKDFYIHIELEDPDDTEDDVDVDIEIKIDNVLVYDDSKRVDLVKNEPYIINISSKDLDKDDLWEDNLMGYNCGRKRVEVTVSGDIKPSESDEADLKIDGDDLEVDIDPEKPTPDDKITITVKDEDGDELEDITVKFTHLGDDNEWDKDDEFWDDKTDRHGEVEVKLSKEDEFKDNPYGKYQIDVWEERGNYCKYTTTIDLRHLLRVSDPEPAEPMVGQDIRVRVTDDSDKPVSGAKIAVSGPGGLKTYNTDAQGYATFRVDSTGTFDIIATKKGYSDSEIKHITILERGAIVIEINPKDQEVGKEIEIKVTSSEGSALKGANVTITKPDGTTEEFTTPDDGKISYTPKSSGTYKLKVEAPLYTTTTKEFNAHNVFKITVSEKLLPNVDITVTVKNQENKPVSGASVSIKDTDVSGTTDANGKFTFNLTEPKEYTMMVKKDGYSDAIKKINIRGILSLKLSSKEIDLGDTIEFVVQDSQGNLITADIKIIKPNGEKESIGESYEKSYKPSIAGEYTISASKSGYETATEAFTVRPYPLVLESKIEGNNLIVTAVSSGKPVSNIAISFDTAEFHEEILTDENGKAILDIVKSNVTGNVTITAIDQNYEKTSITREVKPEAGGKYLVLILILVVLIIIIIVILVLTRGEKKKEGKKKKGKLERTTGTSLHKV